MSGATLSLLLATGGGLGACARHALGDVLSGDRVRRWALPTLLVNLSGSLLLGATTAVVSAAAGGLGTSLLIGFCGGFTTFSGFAWQTDRRFRHAGAVAAVANVALNLGGSLCAFGVGLRLAAVL